MLKVLFVCTGNTCRSPMAEAALKKMLRDRQIKGITVSSAGIAANEGDKLSDNARQALASQGIKNVKHKAKLLTPDMCKNACVICMTNAHKSRLGGLTNVFSAEDIIGESIPDPYGQSVDMYKQCLNKINKLASAVLAEVKSKKGI